MFSIVDNKFSYNGPNSAKWADKEVITPGEWTKFIFVYDPVNITLTGYIDYEYVDTWSVRYAANPNDPLIEVRISAAKANTSINLDNFMIYSGTNYRILDKFDAMGPAEEFEYFVNYMNDETRSPKNRLQAYQRATSLLESIKLDADLQESLAEFIDMYYATDADKDIVAPAKEANLDILREYAWALEDYEGLVNTSNYATVQALVTDIETFIADNSDYIDKSSASYKEVYTSISRFKSLLDRCNNITAFVNALERFDKSYTLAARLKYYEKIVEYYELAGLYLEDVRREVMSDPAILAFEATLDDKYTDIFDYYENCQQLIDSQKAKENSDRIIDCIEFITGLENYEDTEEFWAANFEFIDKYTTIIRDIVNKGESAYDASVDGIAEALLKFEVIDSYFYNSLQDKHIALIKEQLDKYTKTNSYIEKLGICTYVNNYIATNGIDENDERLKPELSALLLKNKAYENELEIYRQDYIVVLEQNTKKFINIVEEMKAYVNYAKLNELYNEALKYYYEMNITEDSRVAIEVFEKYAAEIEQISADSALFIGYANSVRTARNDALLYKALVNCKAYRDKVSEDIEGVSAAIENYEEKLAEYKATADVINADIEEINTAVTVVRTNGVASAVMSIINKIFNR